MMRCRAYGVRGRMQMKLPSAAQPALFSATCIEAPPVVAAAHQAFGAELRAHLGASVAEDSAKRHFSKYATHIALDAGSVSEHATG